jgi:RNA polymerase sigma factor (sigma-70 family)
MRFLKSKRGGGSDPDILQAYRASRDARYIEILFDRYCHLVFAVCMNYLKNEEDSKDAVLHIFEKLPADLVKYEVREFSHWLYILSRNYCMKELKRRRPTVPLDDAGPADEVPDADATGDLGDLSAYLDRLPAALALLNGGQERCIRLFYLEGKTYREIGEETGYTFRQVKSYIQNGRRNLRQYLLQS